MARVADGAGVGDDVAGGVEVHVGGRGERGLLAVVDEDVFAGVLVDEHESAAAEVAGEGVDDGEREADGDGGVDGIAAGLQDSDAGVGGEVMHGDDHGVRGADGLVVLEQERGLAGSRVWHLARALGSARRAAGPRRGGKRRERGGG